jgi:hypothetical protein
MQRVDQHVSRGYLGQVPPRLFPHEALPDILIDYLIRPALRKLLDPVVGLGLLALLGLYTTNSSPTLCWLLVVLLSIRVWRDVRSTLRRLRDEIGLLQHGLLVRAYILRMRPYRSELGEIDGAIFDCAIPVAARRTYVGSFWLSDGSEAVEITKAGRIDVLCLPLTPGTWRVVENVRSEVRYDRMGPIAHIPEDIV